MHLCESTCPPTPPSSVLYQSAAPFLPAVIASPPSPLRLYVTSVFCEQHLKMMARYGQLSGLAASGVGSVPETHSPLFPRDLLPSPAQMGYRSPMVRGETECPRGGHKPWTFEVSSYEEKRKESN